MSRFLVFFCLFATFASAQEPRPGKGINFYSIETEVALGRQIAAEFQRNTTPLVSPAALSYINGIGQRLAPHIGGPPFTYTFCPHRRRSHGCA
jgi:predicted Zn-dependent protease